MVTNASDLYIVLWGAEEWSSFRVILLGIRKLLLLILLECLHSTEKANKMKLAGQSRFLNEASLVRPHLVILPWQRSQCEARQDIQKSMQGA